MSEMSLEIRKKKRINVTKEDIKRGLKRLGLKRGDTVGVHSSLNSFCYVEGGADAVIDAIDRLFFNAFSRRKSSTASAHTKKTQTCT